MEINGYKVSEWIDDISNPRGNTIIERLQNLGCHVSYKNEYKEYIQHMHFVLTSSGLRQSGLIGSIEELMRIYNQITKLSDIKKSDGLVIYKYNGRYKFNFRYIDECYYTQYIQYHYTIYKIIPTLQDWHKTTERYIMHSFCTDQQKSIISRFYNSW